MNKLDVDDLKSVLNDQIDIRVDLWSDSNMFVSIYNDRNDSCVGYTCNREELKGLADFIYDTIGERNDQTFSR